MTTQKPKVYLKLETTGVNIKTDKIILIYLRKYTNIEESEFEEYSQYINPGSVKISDEASNVNGITNEFIENLNVGEFSTYANEIFRFIDGCDLVGYNIKNFHLPMLLAEFARCNLYLNYKKVNVTDLQTLYFDTFKPNSFESAYRLITNKTFVLANIEDYVNKMFEMHVSLLYHPNLNISNEKYFDLTGKILNQDGKYIINFGSEQKYRGKTVFEMFKTGMDYYNYIMTSDMITIDTKIALKILYALYVKQNGK